MKKKHTFVKALIIYCVVFAAVLAAGLIVLRSALVSYEASRPDNAMETFFASHDRSFWTQGLEAAIAASSNEFISPEADASHLGYDMDAEIKWRAAGEDGGKAVYTVHLGSSRICTLHAVQTEDVGFGLKAWEIESHDFMAASGTSLSICLPEGATAEINGVAVSESYISGEGSLSIDTEHSFDIAPGSSVYTVSNMRGPIELTAYSAEGAELRPVTVSDSEVHFLPEPEYSFSFYTLPSAEVSINGQVISSDYAVSVGSKLDESVELLRYECSGLYTEPEISVSIGGEDVLPCELRMGTCYAPDAITTAELSEAGSFLPEFISAYVDFACNRNKAAEMNFVNLAPYLLSSSELYTDLRNSIENIVWATTSDIDFKGYEVYDLIPLGDGRYVCHTNYKVSYTLGANRLDIDQDDVVLIVNDGGKYCVAAMGPGL